MAFLVTAWAKASIVFAMEGTHWTWLAWLWSIGLDAVVLLGLAAAFAIGEGAARWLRPITWVMAASFTAFALVNATYLRISGEQLGWPTIKLGLARWEDVQDIFAEQVAAMFGSIVFWSLVVIAVPVAIGLVLRQWKPEPEANPVSRARQRAHCAAIIALLGLLIWLVAPAPRQPAARHMGKNALLHTYTAWLGDDPGVGGGDHPYFVGYVPVDIVDDAAIRTLANQADRPNVLLLVLESTRYDFTSLVQRAPAATPALAELATRGLSASHARAVVPHTTKSLFSILCGRLPLLQWRAFETSASVTAQCLPEILTHAGYATAFFQSSWGTFEDRPRLVDRLGYQHFEAWEDIGGEPLGYLASDDTSLHEPFARWLDRIDGDQPFFATLLTSGAHHPYRLPRSVRERVAATGAPADSISDRYARLIEAEDQLLGALLEELERQGRLANTIVVVAGDHGEGFGDKGIRQHDNNYYEEGLRVPFVIAGPGVPVRRIDQNVSLADLTPTILGRLGVPITTEARQRIEGRDVIAEPPTGEELRYFSCWQEFRCRGFVLGDHKVVLIPERGSGFYFDLADDPQEQEPRLLTEALLSRLPELHARFAEHYPRDWPFELIDVPYDRWTCPAGRPCRHVDPPSAPGDTHEEPGEP